jgi:hypothetical protein
MIPRPASTVAATRVTSRSHDLEQALGARDRQAGHRPKVQCAPASTLTSEWYFTPDSRSPSE